MLESYDVTSLMLRLIPDVDRKDMRYIRNMVDVTGLKQVCGPGAIMLTPEQVYLWYSRWHRIVTSMGIRDTVATSFFVHVLLTSALRPLRELL